jgi:hypothetical protein
MRLLDGDDVDGPKRRLARQQVVGDLAEGLGDGAAEVLGPCVLGLEGIEDPVVGLIDPERVPGDRARLLARELAAGLQELAEFRLEAPTVNLAAELNGTGVTVNVYRPGGVDTAMQAWIREQDPDRIGTAMHARFNQSFTDGP